MDFKVHKKREGNQSMGTSWGQGPNTASGSQAEKSRENPPARGQSVPVSSLVPLKTENGDMVGGREIF